MSVLITGALKSRWDCVRWLISEGGADANVQDPRGDSVLHIALDRNKAGTAEVTGKDVRTHTTLFCMLFKPE